MKFILGKKEFTLMFIPSANRRVVKFKLPHSVLIIVPTVIVLVLLGFFITVYIMDQTFTSTKENLNESHLQEARELNGQIAEKTSELDKLQVDLIKLSQQTSEFKLKLEEIKKLKHVVSLMADSSTPNSTNSRTPSDYSATPSTQGDVGGSDEPFDGDELVKLTSATKNDLTGLVSDINELLSTLTDSEQKLIKAQHLRDVTPTIWPIDARRITSSFGIRLDPFTARPSMHTGVDIDGDLNDSVYAAAEGTIIDVGRHPEYGNYILIDHTLGIQTQYMHLNQALVSKGKKVQKGDLIGLVGSTGRSTGTHLHYEIIRNGTKINPTPYLVLSRKEK
ncbi:peptidoglycan DD-metalloendopeptidase family protein [Paenibacillus sp. N1-5-1-14]|uniref:M23 family metallopeptidase n=1 Tax=Paenibacillus radicibacter TaxID=2972488 RepID=UPI0021596CB2|nr:peptidoglycan DD-metalloendopeptidase family protein [Paenibacillus radicibacter]MCR8643571.1 peptidoglycan DD-metalloendopeptidase family protein [Paenibacillus radicibacter]